MSNPHFVIRTACPACGGTEGREVYRCSFLEDPVRGYLDRFYGEQGAVEWEYLEGADYILQQCHGCNLVYQQEIFTDEMLRRLYEVWIDPEMAHQRSLVHKDIRTLRGYASRITTGIELLGGEAVSLRFHDFGMGWSHWLVSARTLGCQVSGTEISPERVRHAESLDIEVVPWENLPGIELDYINSEKVFEHLPRPLETMQHLVSALKPGGLIRVSVPEGAEVFRKLRIGDWYAAKGTKNSLNEVSPLEHINCFRRSSIIRMGALAGLEPARIPFGLRVARGVGTNPLLNFIKELLRPAYHAYLDRDTDVLFRKPA